MSAKLLPLGAVVELIRGGLTIRNRDGVGGVPITRIETIAEHFIDVTKVGYAGVALGQRDEWLLKQGDILFSHINSLSHIGKCALYKGEPPRLLHGMNLLNIRPKQGAILPRYLVWALRSDAFRAQLAKHKKPAVNQASISISALRTLTIRVPALAEQEKIAHQLDLAETIVQRRGRSLALLGALLRSGFVEIFGDPAFNAKGRPIALLRDVAEVRDGTHEAPAYVKSGVPLVMSTHLRGDFIDFTSTKAISPSDHERYSSRSSVREGDILFGMIGSIGGATRAPKDREFSVKNVALIRPDPTRISGAYLWALLGHEPFLERVLAAARGGSQKFVGLGLLRALPIPLPEDSETNRFEKFLRERETMRLRVMKAAQDAANLRQTLHHNAFTY